MAIVVTGAASPRLASSRDEVEPRASEPSNVSSSAAIPSIAASDLESRADAGVVVFRVHDSSKTVRELGWQPEYTFPRAVEMLARGDEWRGELTARVGKWGWHLHRAPRTQPAWQRKDSRRCS